MVMVGENQKQAGTGKGALGNEHSHAKGKCVKFSSINVQYKLLSFPPKKPSILVGPGVEFGECAKRQSPPRDTWAKGQRAEAAHQVPFIQNRSCTGGGGWGRGHNFGFRQETME